METRSRLSMNTALRNARIFADDSSEEEEEVPMRTSNIKQEPADYKFGVMSEIKRELLDEDTNFSIPPEAFNNIQIKKEDLDELSSPMKIDPYENSDSNSRRSLKSARIASYKKRESPYKTVVERLPSSSANVSRISFDEKTQSPKNKRRKVEVETDPMILSRRQKQIDYGKNTIGYDEYCHKVPRRERKPDDPQTPNKNIKYSRRGWDGLIKQWRLKLHKYDPNDS